MRSFQMQFVRRMSEQANKLIDSSPQQWLYKRSVFPKYGLKRDDLLNETPPVKEAVRRLSEDLQDERLFRIIRAAYCSARKQYLPEQQWTKLEEDDLYLTPIVEEVKKELQEKEEWENEE